MDEEYFENVDTSSDMDFSDVDVSDDIPYDVLDDIPEDIFDEDVSDNNVQESDLEDTENFFDEDAMENKELDESTDEFDEEVSDCSDFTVDSEEDTDEIPEDVEETGEDMENEIFENDDILEDIESKENTEQIDDIEEDDLETLNDTDVANEIDYIENTEGSEQQSETADEANDVENIESTEQPEDVTDTEAKDEADDVENVENSEQQEEIINTETADEANDVENIESTEQPEDVTDIEAKDEADGVENVEGSEQQSETADEANVVENTEGNEQSNDSTATSEIYSVMDYMSAHNYGREDFATYSQDPQWRQLMHQEYPDYELPELLHENANSQLMQYISEHNYGIDDYAEYSQDPIWRELHSTVYPDSELPMINSESEKKSFSIAEGYADMNMVTSNENGESDDISVEVVGNRSKNVDTNQQELGTTEFEWNISDEEAEYIDENMQGKDIFEQTREKDLPIRTATDSKEYTSIVDSLEKANVEYRPIQLAEQNRSTQDIINRLSGGDRTKGSCSSLALAYAGNKAGYNVLDFRGGDSRCFFSSRDSIQTIADMPDIKSLVLRGTNDIETANQLMSGAQNGKEYYLATGQHAAIIRRNGENIEYLELQHPSSGNGWHLLNDFILQQRFGCRTSRETICSSFLMDVDSMASSTEFKKILGFINTAEASQRKGATGNVR